MADHPSPCARQQKSGDCELETLAKSAGIEQSRFAKRTVARGLDDSSLAIAVDHDACILCDRCIRGCDEIKNNFVPGRMGKGCSTGIAFDLNAPMGNSTCISCGECMVSCPTGALTNKGVAGTSIAASEDGYTFQAEELLRIPVFKGVSGTFLELNRGAIVKRRYRKGELICREGEFGSTAFYIVEGTAKVSISSPIAHVRTHGDAKGFFKRLTSTLVNRREDVREEETRDRMIPIDASVNLSYGNPVASLGPGDLFGEMTCLNFYPRSATVRAESDVVAYEMLRNVLDIMMKNKTFRAQIDASYRARFGKSSSRCAHVCRSLAGLHRPPEAKCGVATLRRRRSYRTPGRSSGLFLPHTHRLRESLRKFIPVARWFSRTSRAEIILVKLACSAAGCEPPCAPL